MKNHELLPSLPCAVLSLALASGCQSFRSEVDLSDLEERWATDQTIRVDSVELARESALEGSKLLWIHRASRSDGTPIEDKINPPTEVALAQAKGALERQLAAMGFAPEPEAATRFLLEAEIQTLELRTETTRETGSEGIRTGVATIVFRLRDASDRRLLFEGEKSEWTIFSGADVEFDPGTGRRTFRASDPEPRLVALRFALREFLLDASFTLGWK